MRTHHFIISLLFITACDVEHEDASLERSLAPDISIVENDIGEAMYVDANGRPVVGDITLDHAPAYIDQGGYLALIDGVPIDPSGCVPQGGELDIAAIEGGPTLRCACVDANGVKWTQDCDFFPFFGPQTCEQCCNQHGGGHVPQLGELAIRPKKGTGGTCE